MGLGGVGLGGARLGGARLGGARLGGSRLGGLNVDLISSTQPHSSFMWCLVFENPCCGYT